MLVSLEVFNMKIAKKYIYKLENGKEVYDWCCNCARPIQQIEINGEFCCEFCNSSNNIDCQIRVK